MIDYINELTDSATTSAYALAATLTVGLIIIAVLSYTAARHWKIVSAILIVPASICFALSLVFADPVVDAAVYHAKQLFA